MVRSEPGLFIGIDWADQEHAAYVMDRQSNGRHETIEHTPDAIETWVADKLRQADGQSIAIIVEQKRGALLSLAQLKNGGLPTDALR